MQFSLVNAGGISRKHYLHASHIKHTVVAYTMLDIHLSCRIFYELNCSETRTQPCNLVAQFGNCMHHKIAPLMNRDKHGVHNNLGSTYLQVPNPSHRTTPTTPKIQDICSLPEIPDEERNTSPTPGVQYQVKTVYTHKIQIRVAAKA